MTYRATALQSFAWAKQPDSKGGLAWGASMPRTFATTSAGTTTTIVSTELAGYTDGNDDLVGWIVECRSATNTQNEGLRRRIKESADGSSTYTIDPLPAATADNDVFAIMMPPHLLAVARSAASSTNKRVGTRDRNETSGRYKGNANMGGYYLIRVAGDNASNTNLRIISTNSSTSQNVRLGTNLSGAVAIGDYFEIWKFPAVGGKLLDLSADPLQRENIIGTFGRQPGVRGLRAGSGGPEANFRGPGASRAGLVSESDEALSCVFSAVAGSATAIGDAGSSTTTVIKLDSALGAVGQMMLTSTGYACMINSISTNDNTVSPAIPVATVTTDNHYIGRTYTPATAVQAALAINQWRSDCVQEYAWGCVPAPTFSGERGQFLKIALPMMVTDWMRIGASGTALSRTFTPRLPTIDEMKLGVGRLNIDGTELNCFKFSFDPGLNLVPRVNLNSPNQLDGYELAGDNPTGSVEIFYDSNERKALDDFLNGKVVEMLLQFGDTPGTPGCFALWVRRAHYTGATIDDESGLVKLTLPFEASYVAGSALPRWAAAIF